MDLDNPDAVGKEFEPRSNFADLTDDAKSREYFHQEEDSRINPDSDK